MAVETSTPTIETKPLPTRDDGNFLTGNLKDFVESSVDFMLDTGKIAPVVKCRFAWFGLHMVTDAEYAKHILVSNNRNYIKDQRMVKIIETGSTPSLFSTDGDEWLWRRRLMQPAFHRKQIAMFADAIVNETERLLTDWQDGVTIDVDEAMKLVTMMLLRSATTAGTELRVCKLNLKIVSMIHKIPIQK